MYVVHVLLFAVTTGFALTCLFVLAPSLAKTPALRGSAIAVSNFFYYIGAFIGAPTVTFFVESNNGNWPSGNIPLMAASVICLIFTILLIVINRKSSQIEKNQNEISV